MTLSLDSDKYLTLDPSTVLELIAEGTEQDSKTTVNLRSGGVLNEITEPLSAAVKRYMDEGKIMSWTMSGWPSGFEPASAAEFQAYLGGDMTWEECVEAVKNDWASLR